ncbi:hypothetical protein DM860_000523 [Cuscuta australis]|uniref:Uncharacterized protein n=1 Tax=Cuscuta australis TaxID=267555 RepID=A0A328D0H3_9ASTE|nr:hypothetical protein DM860_000523 [Cuscuta australis]
MEAKPVHPLHQISEFPTHKLLLKQWLKEEDLILNRIVAKEAQIDSVRKPPHGCRRSWIPSLCSLLCSLGLIWAVRYKTDTEHHLEKLLEREKEDGKLLGKCVEELRKKGAEFDLMKEVDALRRAKSMRMEAKAAALRKWSGRDFSTLFFFTLSCVVLGLTNLILCG